MVTNLLEVFHGDTAWEMDLCALRRCIARGSSAPIVAAAAAAVAATATTARE